MKTRLRLAIRFAYCILFHDVRQRQNALRCWLCHPPARRPDPAVTSLLEGIAEELRASK